MLSAFAGASYELHDALLVNPSDTEHVARTIAAAIDMPRLEQRRRMRRLRGAVAGADAQAWAASLLADVASAVSGLAQPLDRGVQKRNWRFAVSLPLPGRS